MVNFTGASHGVGTYEGPLASGSSNTDGSLSTVHTCFCFLAALVLNILQARLGNPPVHQVL
jgi:hypothetical protein